VKTITCTHCGKELGVPTTLAGEVVACPHCKGRIRLPANVPEPSEDDIVGMIQAVDPPMPKPERQPVDLSGVGSTTGAEPAKSLEPFADEWAQIPRVTAATSDERAEVLPAPPRRIAESEPAKPPRRFKAIREFGIMLMLVGFVGALCGLTMKTTAANSDTLNLGLLNDSLKFTICGCSLWLSGALLFGLGYVSKE
jgi:DNA-directed RNA polymerase subunit RPC12/RpoP